MFKKNLQKSRKQFSQNDVHEENKSQNNDDREDYSVSQESNMENQFNQQQFQFTKSIKLNSNKDDLQSYQENTKNQDKLSQLNQRIQNIQESLSHKVNFSGVSERNYSKGSKGIGQIRFMNNSNQYVNDNNNLNNSINKNTFTNNNNNIISNPNKNNIIDMINSGIEQKTTNVLKFQVPYQLALIYLTWIYYGFSFIMRQKYENMSDSVTIDFEENNIIYSISGILIFMGIVGLSIWRFVIIRKKIRLEDITLIQRMILMIGFLFNQILVMESFVLKKNMGDCWVITGTIVQTCYLQSISRVNLLNLIYIGISTLYLIIRFQFIVDWEWESFIYSILVCTVIVFHQEKIQVETQKQTKQMISTTQKAHRLKNLYSDILGMIPEGVAIFDKNQQTIFCNKTVKDLFKCKKNQLNKILLGLSTNNQQHPSPQPSPHNNNQFNNSTHTLPNQQQQQQYFKSAPSNLLQNNSSSLAHTYSNQNNFISQQQAVKPNYSNIYMDQSNSMIGQDNLRDDNSVIQQSQLHQSLNGSSKLIQFKNESFLKNLNTSNYNRASNDFVELGNFNTLYDVEKYNKKSKYLEQQKSIFTPSFKSPDYSLYHHHDSQNNPTFAKIQTKELQSPQQSQGEGIVSKTNSNLQQSPLKINCNKTNINLNKNDLHPNSNNSNSIPQTSSIQINVMNENPQGGQSHIEMPSPNYNNSIHQSGFFAQQESAKGNNSGVGEFIKSVRGIDQNIIDQNIIDQNLNDFNQILSNNQLINNQNQIQNQNSNFNQTQFSYPKQQSSLHKKLPQQVVNASSQRNEEEDESDIDIFNNFLYQQEGQKIFKKKIINQKKSKDIMQGETKVTDILSDLFGEIAGQQKNTQQNYYQPGNQNVNNLEPVILSPINQTVHNFVNQSNNNINKEIPHTPTSVKKLEFKKSKTFFSQMNKNSNLGYMQYQEDMIKVQVRWKDQIFVLKFLLFEIETSENNSEIFILVLVDPLWQEYYNKRMEEVQKYKMKMFASLSHELRTPLNCTISMLEGLEQFITDPTLIDDYLYPALHSQKLLLNQINDILDFAQIDSGKFKYTFVDFNLEKLLQDCQTLIQMQANIKSLDLQLIYDSRLNQTIKSDPNRIRQILLNFLSNSLKFTPENGTMRIIAEPVFLNETKIQKYIRLSVQDSGIGMKPETLKNIFSAFNKTEYEAEGMNSQGCGLGLAISQSISKGLCIQSFGSQFNPQQEYQIATNQIGIQVESVYQQGSTFSFIIQDMNPKPVNTIPYNHNNSFTHSVQPLDMINEEDLANSYMSGKNENNLQQQHIHKSSFPLAELMPRTAKEIKDISIHVDSCCVQNESIDQEGYLQPQFMELGNFFNGQYNQNNDIASTHGGHSPTLKQKYPVSQYSPHYQKQVYPSDNQVQFVTTQNTSSTSTFQSINKFNSKTHSNSTNNELHSAINQSVKLVSSNNQIIVANCENEERLQICPIQLNEALKTLTPTSLLKNNILAENLLRYSTTNSNSVIHSNTSIPSKIIPSTQKVVNITRTMTNKSLGKTNPAQGFNGYHSKSNLNEDQGVRLMIYLSQYIENQVCENKCSPILIVDDNQFNILALQRMLQQFFNVAVDKAFDGKQAYDKICARYSPTHPVCKSCQKYEIIFMDIEMPILNGYEVIKELNDFFMENQIQKEDVPYIIACTAHGGDEEQSRAKMSGFDDYIQKPIMKNDIQKLLCDWFYYAHSEIQAQKYVLKEHSQVGLSSLPSDK